MQSKHTVSAKQGFKWMMANKDILEEALLYWGAKECNDPDMSYALISELCVLTNQPRPDYLTEELAGITTTAFLFQPSEVEAAA